jgi:flagella basal body P-ring formation protein FlgA
MSRLGLLLALLAAPAASATEADVVAAAEAAVAGIWPDAEVRVVRLSGGAETAPPPLRVRFRDEAPRGRVSAEVEAQAPDGTWAPAGWAYLDVAVFETAPVLTADVDRGAPVAAAVRLHRVETTRLRDVLPADALGAGWTATRSLRAGTVLTDRHVEAPAAAETGDALRVRYARGAVTVVLACEARERGAVGEAVRAVCADTGATYRVLLTAPGEGDWAATL